MRKLSLGFALLVLLQLGVSAPEHSSEAPKAPASPKGSKSQQQSFSAAASPQAFGAQIAKFFGGKTGQELMAEKTGKMAAAGMSATQALSGKSSAQARNVPSVKAPSVPKPVPSGISAVQSGNVPPPPTPRASVPQIRQEIQKILDLNKKIKSVQSGSTAQFQRVQEQARIHQKILNELEASQKKTAAQKVPTKSALLAQEKLRIIHEETQRNAQMVAGLKEAPAKALPKDTLKAKTSAS